jgi:hypothetical protein
MGAVGFVCWRVFTIFTPEKTLVYHMHVIRLDAQAPLPMGKAIHRI